MMTVPHTPIPILLYRCVSAYDGPTGRNWAVAPERFAAQLSYLYDGGYQALTCSQLAEVFLGRRVLPERPVLITFDDAYADFVSSALPMLLAHEFVSTLF